MEWSKDVRRTSQQRGCARSCYRRLLRCKSPLGRLLIACDPDRGCHEVTGVKKSVRKKDLAFAKSFSYPEPCLKCEKPCF